MKVYWSMLGMAMVLGSTKATTRWYAAVTKMQASRAHNQLAVNAVTPTPMMRRATAFTSGHVTRF